MNLFYQPTIAEGIDHLDAEESRHAVRVLRMTEGSLLDVTDGKGFFYSCQITKADPKKCVFKIVEKKNIPQRKYKTHVAIAPTKNIDRTEWFVEKAVEIGIDEISFLLCKNSERKAINLERIKKIAVSAMKQSQQAWLPKLNAIVPFAKIFNELADQKFIAHVDTANRVHLKSAAQPEKKYLVLIGPEGDFSKEELTLAFEHDFEKVSLGANRLRTETAALVAVQILRLIN